MNRLALLVLLAFALAACSGGNIIRPLDPFTPNPACDAELEKITAGKAGPSLIRAKIPNPCDAYRVCVTAAKVGVIWDAYTVDELIKWAGNTRKAMAGMTYDGMKTLLTLEIKKFNDKMGATFLVLSDLIVVVQSPAPINDADLAIMDEGFARLIEEAKKLALLV